MVVCVWNGLVQQQIPRLIDERRRIGFPKSRAHSHSTFHGKYVLYVIPLSPRITLRWHRSSFKKGKKNIGFPSKWRKCTTRPSGTWSPTMSAIKIYTMALTICDCFLVQINFISAGWTLDFSTSLPLNLKQHPQTSYFTLIHIFFK